jgi:hypothetical protein
MQPQHSKTRMLLLFIGLLRMRRAALFYEQLNQGDR